MAQELYKNLNGLRICVAGAGVTGLAVARSLTKRGVEVTLIDENKGSTEEFPVVHPDSITITNFDRLLISPGWRDNHPVIQAARAAKVPLINEVDYAWSVKKPAQKWISLTGTNGKTSTVELTAAMLQAGGVSAIACGNVGTTVIESVESLEDYQVLVLELSSFQLHWMEDASFIAAAILNIAQDHIDWHGSFEVYAATKGKIYQNTLAAAVYNLRDARTQELLENADVVEGCRAIGFSVGVPGPSDIGYSEDILCDRAFLDNRYHEALEVATFEDIAEIGVVTPHLLANVAAATALARACGAEPADIRSAIRSFKLDKHRIELVAVHNGISWIDDSKATNPHATNASLESFEHVVWIVGGLLKGVDIAPLVQSHASRLRGAVVIGAERQVVLDALAAHAIDVPVIEISGEDNSQVMTQAVLAASNLAAEGDTVLLAPSSASMDQFKDYADRGNQFATAVHTLIGEN